MLTAWILFAEAAADANKGEPSGILSSPLPMFLMIGVVAYFLLYLPSRKEKQQRQALLSALKKNDKIITNGGIIGVVANLREGTEEVTIKSDEAKFLILRSSIARIITEPEKEPQKP
jgi:preprotein translocase subunit YajC